MWHEKTLGVWSDFVDDPVVFSQDKVKFTVVHLELFFLKKNNLSRFRDVNANAREALSFTDKCEYLTVKVHIQLVVVRVSDYQSGLKSSLGLLDFVSPLLSPQVLE